MPVVARRPSPSAYLEEDVSMSLTVDDHTTAHQTLLSMTSDEIRRRVAYCERLIRADQASEREYALYISATRELLRRTEATS
ncbi:hypothetical protein BH23DEI1_BH23DEI1_00170 [soil metagenome]